MDSMRTFRLDKLVHDLILEDYLKEGARVDYEVITGEHKRSELERKLLEEQAEFEASTTDEEKEKERMDIDNILFALGHLVARDFIPSKTFDKGHYIHTVTVPPMSWLAQYHADNPDRFPEVV